VTTPGRPSLSQTSPKRGQRRHHDPGVHGEIERSERCGDVVVNFSTEDGSATSILSNPNLQDFVSQTGTLTFAKGETQKTIPSSSTATCVTEGASEDFKLNLRDGGGVLIDEATGTITDDDDKPKLTFDGANNGDITVIEGNDGVTTVKLKLKLSNPSQDPISINVSLAGGARLRSARILRRSPTLLSLSRLPWIDDCGSRVPHPSGFQG
jgi:hypothetical protein